MLVAQQLMDKACETTGLSDFGEASFRVGLDRLVDSINRDCVLSELGQKYMPGSIVDHLSNRLKVEDWYRRHPEIEDEVIRDPVFIIGMPRTGSTALGHMLALDTQTRSLRGWEAYEPCPPPDINVDNDPRIARNEARTEMMNTLAPGLIEALPRNAHAPEECYTVLNLTLNSVAMNGWCHIPGYDKWVMTEGMPETDAAYRYHRRVLKLLQWKTPATRWELRAPTHTAHLEALLKAYPDARFIVTHRKPSAAVTSVSSLIHQVHELFVANPSPTAIGAQQYGQLLEYMRRLFRFRDELGEARFFDIYHREQVAGPEPGIRALYRWLGWEFTDEFAASLANWREENPKGKHKPDPALYGLDSEEVDRRFAFYIERFGERM